VSESKSGKMLLVAILILFGGGGFLLYPQVQWFRYEMAARDAISDKALTRFPDADKVLAVESALGKSATALGIKDAKVSLKLTQRRVGPAVMWFLAVNIKSGTKEFETEKRVETEWQSDELDLLREGGCVVSRLGGDDED
jgi:hypothetical protein